jgi:hypothetical protein
LEDLNLSFNDNAIRIMKMQKKKPVKRIPVDGVVFIVCEIMKDSKYDPKKKIMASTIHHFVNLVDISCFPAYSPMAKDIR